MKFKHLGIKPYDLVLKEMILFTQTRDPSTEDEVWFCEHPPTFTYGASELTEKLKENKEISVIKTDRGGKITYHGPGQLVCYPLVDLHKNCIYPKTFLSLLEHILLDLFNELNVPAVALKTAPGIYLNKTGGFGIFRNLAKVASIGIKISKFRTYHGFSVNINADLSPFLKIDPCGYPGLRMVNLKEYCEEADIELVELLLIRIFKEYFKNGKKRNDSTA